jgi:dCTP deaminase
MNLEKLRWQVKRIISDLLAGEFSFLRGKSLLSDTAILRHMEAGNIVIDVFDARNLGTCSYDVTLGEWYWREHNPDGGVMTYNPWSEKDVRRVWGAKPFVAEPARIWMDEHGPLENIHPDDQIIWIAPGETILCHTNEFIGGRGGIITTMMKARSTLGRNFIEVCKCAGWGDVGYVNRWTMEFTNNSRFYQIPLVVGRRVAQIAFFEVEKIRSAQYEKDGKYQDTDDLEEIKKKWNPTAMLPKMFKDREIRRAA